MEVETSLLIHTRIAGLSGGAINAALGYSAMFDGSSTFSRNLATYGGAIAVDEGKITLSRNSNFLQNSGASGGAISIQGHPLVLIGKHKFTSNSAKFNGYGGSIRALRTIITLYAHLRSVELDVNETVSNL